MKLSILDRVIINVSIARKLLFHERWKPKNKNMVNSVVRKTIALSSLVFLTACSSSFETDDEREVSMVIKKELNAKIIDKKGGKLKSLSQGDQVILWFRIPGGYSLTAIQKSNPGLTNRLNDSDRINAILGMVNAPMWWKQGADLGEVEFFYLKESRSTEPHIGSTEDFFLWYNRREDNVYCMKSRTF